MFEQLRLPMPEPEPPSPAEQDRRDQQTVQAYQDGRIDDYRNIRRSMGEMAEGTSPRSASDSSFGSYDTLACSCVIASDFNGLTASSRATTPSVTLVSASSEKNPPATRQRSIRTRRNAAKVWLSGLFLETHPDPDNAFSDGPNSWPLDRLTPLLERLMAIDAVVKAGDGDQVSGR